MQRQYSNTTCITAQYYNITCITAQYYNIACIATRLADYIYLNDDAQKDNLKEIDSFLDGFSYYDNFLKITPSDKNINTIKTTVNSWDPYRTGIIDNFDNVQSKNYYLFNFQIY